MYKELSRHGARHTSVKENVAVQARWPAPRELCPEPVDVDPTPPDITDDLVPLNKFIDPSKELLCTDRISYFFILDDIINAIYDFIQKYNKGQANGSRCFRTILCNIQASIVNQFKRHPTTKFSETFVKPLIITAAATYPIYTDVMEDSSLVMLFSYALVTCLHHCITTLFYCSPAPSFWDDMYMFICGVENKTVRNTMLYMMKMNNIFPTPDLWGRIAVELFQHEDPRVSLYITFEDHLGSVLSYPMHCTNLDGSLDKSYVIIEAIRTHKATLKPHVLHWCIHNISVHSHIFSAEVYDVVKKIDYERDNPSTSMFSWVFMGRILSTPPTYRQLWTFAECARPLAPQSDVTVLYGHIQHHLAEIICSLNMFITGAWDKSVTDKRWTAGVMRYQITTEILLVLRAFSVLGCTADANVCPIEAFMRSFYCRTGNFAHYCPIDR